MLNDFEKALSDAANKGKGDIDIFDSLTKDKQGLFASQSPANVNMGRMGSAGGAMSDTDKLSDAEYDASLYKKGND